MTCPSGDSCSPERVHEAFSFLRENLPVSLQNPKVAIVCGSGLGGLANTIRDEPRAEFDYSSIPHFPHLTGKKRACSLYIEFNILIHLIVPGHAGKLIFGLLDEQVPVVLMVGRAQ